MLKFIIIALLIGAIVSKRVRKMIQNVLKKYNEAVISFLTSGCGFSLKTAKRIKLVINIILIIIILKIIF